VNVNIQEVTVSTVQNGKKSYQVAEVVYTNDRGENKTKKIMSFSNPAVFAIVSKNPRGSFVAESDGAPYYNWTSLTPANSERAAPAAAKSTPVKSTYETPEERARRQVLIVRQSSLTNALKYFELRKKGDDDIVNLDQVFAVAQDMVDWVMDIDEFQEGFEKLESVDGED